MTPAQAQNYLESFVNHEIHLDRTNNISFKLKRVQKLLSALGDPQNNLKIVHVAGSKGKGSVCALTANILKNAGYSVGLYTSPHLNSYRERIRVLEPQRLNRKQAPGASLRLDGISSDIFPDMISEKRFCAVLEEIKPTVEKMHFDEPLGRLSFFEVFTSLALYYFSKQNVDIVVLETGLGGRLDATNAVGSFIAAITPISLEHTNILGSDITQIAKEKAAIIKSSAQKVIIAPQEGSAQEVLKNRCRKFNIDPLWIGKYMHCELLEQSLESQEFDLTSLRARYSLNSPLLGKHQRGNCAVAVGIIEALMDCGFQISSKAIEKGVRSIFWPGRFEVVGGRPLIILDGAHNKASVTALIDLIVELFEERKITLVLGISRDKDVTSISEAFTRVSEHTIFVKSDHPRAKNLPGAISVKKALDLIAHKSEKNDIVIVAGSLFVVAEARKILIQTGMIEDRKLKMEDRGLKIEV